MAKLIELKVVLVVPLILIYIWTSGMLQKWQEGVDLTNPTVENNLLRLLKVEPMQNDIVNNRSRNGFASILQIWDSFEPIGIGPTSYTNFVEGVSLIVLCKVWTENYLVPFGKITEQFTDLDFGSILNSSYLAWTNMCHASILAKERGFWIPFWGNKNTIVKKPTWKILVDQKHGHTSMKLETVEVGKKKKLKK
jgi:hypothetical protein